MTWNNQQTDIGERRFALDLTAEEFARLGGSGNVLYMGFTPITLTSGLYHGKPAVHMTIPHGVDCDDAALYISEQLGDRIVLVHGEIHQRNSTMARGLRKMETAAMRANRPWHYGGID